ncbi:MAG: CoxG family protein [Halodesulfurarchaeum sp.]
MEFDGTFELEDTTVDEVWIALSDPVLIQRALPGCEFLLEVEDPDNVDFDDLAARAESLERELSEDPSEIADRAFKEGHSYAAIVQVGVGSVKPAFETVVTISERAKPRMHATGEGSAGSSSFEMSSWMELAKTDTGVAVEWGTEADVFGRVAQLGGRVLNPVANRVVKKFFESVQDELEALEIDTDAALAASETEG